MLFDDQPFLNRLYLMLLLTIRHEIEKELIGIQARKVDGGQNIKATDWWTKIWELQHTKRNGKIKPKHFNYKDIEKVLDLDKCDTYKFIEPLRLLSNIFKHNIPIEPDEKLLKSLNLFDDDKNVNYCAIDESIRFREGLAKFINLSIDADYRQITEKYVDIATEFIDDVEHRNKNQLGMVKGAPVQFDPDSLCE